MVVAGSGQAAISIQRLEALRSIDFDALLGGVSNANLSCKWYGEFTQFSYQPTESRVVGRLEPLVGLDCHTC
jgi:hypothetical protein